MKQKFIKAKKKKSKLSLLIHAAKNYFTTSHLITVHNNAYLCLGFEIIQTATFKPFYT